MIYKGRTLTMRHLIRTQRVDVDWLIERLRNDPGIFLKYVSTKAQLADLLTKGSFTAAQWNILCHLGGIGKPYPLKNTTKSSASPPAPTEVPKAQPTELPTSPEAKQQGSKTPKKKGKAKTTPNKIYEHVCTRACGFCSRNPMAKAFFIGTGHQWIENIT